MEPSEAESQLDALLRNAGDRPYRDLIQHHIRRQSEPQLREAAMGAASTLPVDLQPHVMEYIDVLNDRFGYEPEFWATATCRTAVSRVIDAAFDALPIPTSIISKAAMLNAENHEFTFRLFQVATVSFAYSASSQRAQRRFMGISKGFLLR